jgi:hypothetical protein
VTRDTMHHMPFIAETECVIPSPPDAVFDRLADHASWSSWMPASFRPLDGSIGTLKLGVRFRMRVAKIPATLVVSAAERGKELAWRGGIKRLLHANHRFVFEADGNGGTRVRSIEMWDGPLSRFFRPLVKPLAERIGREQLDALATSLV